MQELILPTGYLSYSQIVLWEGSGKDSYRKKYYPEIRPEHGQTVYMRFGNDVTLAMERGEEWVAFLPRLKTFEREFDCVIDGVRLRGAIDQFEDGAFNEQKTTLKRWTDAKISKHFQLDMYSMIIEFLDGTVVDECNLLWAETEKVEPDTMQRGLNATREPGLQLRLTGKYELTPRIISSADRQIMRDRIVRVAKEIAEDYAALGHLYN